MSDDSKEVLATTSVTVSSDLQWKHTAVLEPAQREDSLYSGMADVIGTGGYVWIQLWTWLLQGGETSWLGILDNEPLWPGMGDTDIGTSYKHSCDYYREMNHCGLECLTMLLGTTGGGWTHLWILYTAEERIDRLSPTISPGERHEAYACAGASVLFIYTPLMPWLLPKLVLAPSGICMHPVWRIVSTSWLCCDWSLTRNFRCCRSILIVWIIIIV